MPAPHRLVGFRRFFYLGRGLHQLSHITCQTETCCDLETLSATKDGENFNALPKGGQDVVRDAGRQDVAQDVGAYEVTRDSSCITTSWKL